MNITQQLKERARDKYFRTEKGILRLKTTVIGGEQFYKNADLTDIDTLIETTITELIKHIEGRVPELVDEPEEAIYLEEIYELLSDIKKGA